MGHVWGGRIIFGQGHRSSGLISPPPWPHVHSPYGTWKYWAPNSQTTFNKGKVWPKSFYSSWAYTVCLKPKLWKHLLPLGMTFKDVHAGGWEPALLDASTDNVWALARFLFTVSGFGVICFPWPGLGLFFFSPSGDSPDWQVWKCLWLARQLWGVAYILELPYGIGWSQLSVGLSLPEITPLLDLLLLSSGFPYSLIVFSWKPSSLDPLDMNPYLQFCF